MRKPMPERVTTVGELERIARDHHRATVAQKMRLVGVLVTTAMFISALAGGVLRGPYPVLAGLALVQVMVAVVVLIVGSFRLSRYEEQLRQLFERSTLAEVRLDPLEPGEKLGGYVVLETSEWAMHVADAVSHRWRLAARATQCVLGVLIAGGVPLAAVGVGATPWVLVQRSVFGAALVWVLIPMAGVATVLAALRRVPLQWMVDRESCSVSIETTGLFRGRQLVSVSGGDITCFGLRGDEVPVVTAGASHPLAKLHALPGQAAGAAPMAELIRVRAARIATAVSDVLDLSANQRSLADVVYVNSK